ncbi:MAG TPA: protein kinase [Oculatellaceae cyanobacterium]
MMIAAEPTVSVLIVDDHHITRAGLRLALQQEHQFEVVGDALDGRAAVERAMQLRPSVILMDIGLPLMDGLEATWRIKKQLPLTRVIVITSHDGDDDILAALGVGADGYCLKDISAPDLIDGIKQVATGSSWLDPRIVHRTQRLPIKEEKRGDVVRILCARERDILRLLEQGTDNQGIAQRLGVDVEVVDMYKVNIMEKLFNKSSRGLASGGSEAIPATRPLQQDFQPPVVELPAQVEAEVAAEPVRQSKGSVAPEGLVVGSVFADRYAVESFVGEGGMGLVYRAKHLHMNRRVAIKVLHSSLLSERHLVRRFKQESMTASTLNHPNVVTIFDFGISQQGQPFLIMDYLDGCGLNTVLEKDGFLDLNRFLSIYLQVCDGLAAAHAKDIIHCDLKPSNIMLVKDGLDREVVKIVDFGLSVVIPRDTNVQSQLTDSFEVYGSPCYMSPEQCAGSKLDARSDVYAVGCAMYESIVGSPVFTGKTPFEVFAKQLRSLPERFATACPNRSIPFFLEQIVFKALAKNPQDRYQSVLQMKDDLLRLVRTR